MKNYKMLLESYSYTLGCQMRIKEKKQIVILFLFRYLVRKISVIVGRIFVYIVRLVISEKLQNAI